MCCFFPIEAVSFAGLGGEMDIVSAFALLGATKAKADGMRDCSLEQEETSCHGNEESEDDPPRTLFQTCPSPFLFKLEYYRGDSRAL